MPRRLMLLALLLGLTGCEVNFNSGSNEDTRVSLSSTGGVNVAGSTDNIRYSTTGL